MVNLPTKFEVLNFTRYGNMKGVAKCRKWGGLEWLGVTQGYGQCDHSTERIRVTITFHSNYAPYLAPFLRCSEILVENRPFEPTPPLFGAPLGVISLEFRQDFWHKETKVPGLSLFVSLCDTSFSHVCRTPDL